MSIKAESDLKIGPRISEEKSDMIARRAEELAPFMVMEVLERARKMERQGEDIIHLEVGEPDFDVLPQ